MEKKTILLKFLCIVIAFISAPYAHAEKKQTILPESKPFIVKKLKHKKAKQTLQNIGWVESVCIGDLSLKLRGKIDTGATTSSINAEIIKIVKRGNQRYVFYRVVDGERKSDVIEAKLTRYTLIKPKIENSNAIRRPVVMTEFKIGQKKIREEINLAERDHFSYPLLIGRNVLINNFIVDVSKKFTQRTHCISR